MSEPQDFTGKVVVVTGAASGQGKVASEMFARRGAKVVVGDIDLKGAEQTAADIAGAAIRVDVARERDIEAMMRLAVERFGGVDVVFNNAGVGFSASNRYKMASIVETPEDAFDAILAINLKGVALGCKHAIPLMRERGGGAIVNNASINALAGVSGADAYTAAKGGVVALTRALASEWGKYRIRVNCLCPGPVATPMIQSLLDQASFREAMIANVPLQRAADRSEIASVAVFLASDAASYVNGELSLLTAVGPTDDRTLPATMRTLIQGSSSLRRFLRSLFVRLCGDGDQRSCVWAARAGSALTEALRLLTKPPRLSYSNNGEKKRSASTLRRRTKHAASPSPPPPSAISGPGARSCSSRP